MTTSEESLSPGDILDDLALIGRTIEDCIQSEGDASYESVQQRLAQSLALHLLSYVRFLENQGALIYNRISDSMELTDEGKQAMGNLSAWTADVEAAFAEHLGDGAQSDDDMTNVVDIDSIGRDLLAQFDVVTGNEGQADNDDRLADIAMGIDDLISEVSEAVETPGVSEDSAFESFGEEEDMRTGAVPLDEDFLLGDEPSAPSTSDGSWSISEEESVSQISEAGSEVEADSEPAAEPERAPDPSPAPAQPTLKSLSRPLAQSTATKRNEQSMQDQYERIEEIGSGGIGTVYRARQVKLNRDVAVKEVREIFNVFAGVQRDDIIARFTEIVQTHAALLHPNIVQIIDIETSGEYPFLVMQYAPSGNLRRLIDVDDRPPLSVALKYFLQILHALNAAHDRGIVHGSIKPENVVLDKSGNALLTDFGISRVVEREGGKGNQVYVGVGTVAYMSPEQFQDPNKASIKSDIYSLGIMLYEMLTGKVPGRRSPMPSSFYPDIPRKLDDIFDCMSMDREEDRYNSIDEIIAELYGSAEVMDILDKRSGVLFLRDPIAHGEVGLVHAEAPEPVAPIADFIHSHDAMSSASAVSTLDEDSSDAHEDQSLEEISSEVDEAPAAAAEEDTGEEGAPEGDVLDKLNKYGELFEED